MLRASHVLPRQNKTIVQRLALNSVTSGSVPSERKAGSSSRMISYEYE